MSSLVNHSVTNLINGVSQQATSVRLDNQLEEQVNCFSDVTKGLTIRNGLELKNVVSQDLSGRHCFEFDVDGVKYMLALNANDGTPLLHVPLTADVEELTASITDADYFKDISGNDLRIIEDKDYVYILNKKKEVGSSNLKSTFYDIKITNDVTTLTDTVWDTGTYTLTITSVADPETSATVVESPIDIVVDDTMTPLDVANAINATTITNETGECTAVGNKSSYRLAFAVIPEDFNGPTVSIAETTAIQGGFSSTVYEPNPNGSFFYNDDFKVERRSVYNSTDGIFSSGTYVSYYYFFWAGTEIGSTPATNKTWKNGIYTYFVGNFVGLLGDFSVSEHQIRRESPFTSTVNYTPSVIQPNTTLGSEFSTDKFPDEGMIWVTGVASNQTYDVTVEYTDAAGTPQTPITLTTINVGTTTSNIKLNWVAGQIQSQLNATTHFSATTYNNAVHVNSTTPYAYFITNIKVANNFDITSLTGAIKASVDNENGVTDISTLPPTFLDGFKVRVGNESTEGANYYLRYDSNFQGWKECGIDESRVLDSVTMPYIIDKDKLKKTQLITIEPTSWERSKAGDADSNPYPSFVGRTINDIFFYGSRLGVATDDSIIMSAIDKPTVFFRTTCNKTVTSERVDIKLDSSKIGYAAINNVVTYDGKLFINTGSIQSVLLVNTSFDLTSARLSEVSSYTLGDRKPLPVDNGLYFSLTNNGFSNIYNYQALGNNTYEAKNITKHIPTYIEGTVDKMGYADNFAVMTVEEDRKVLYTQNRYSQGSDVLQNAWHRWTLPYDIEHFFFSENNLYLLMTATDSLAATKTFVCKYDLTPQVVEEASAEAYIGWRPYLDCWTKDKSLIENFTEFKGINDKYGKPYDTVTEAYDSTEITQINLGAVDGPYYDASSPVFYWNVVGDTVTLVWNDGTPIVVGNSAQTFVDFGGYRYFKGDESVTSGYFNISRAAITTEVFYEDDIVYGVPFELTIELSEIIPRTQGQDGYVVMNYAKLLLRRMRLYLSKSGVFKVNVDFEDRQDYIVTYTGQPLGRALLGRGSVSDINFNFPINGRSNKVKITITSDSSTPFNLLSAEWQGQLTVKGRNI